MSILKSPPKPNQSINTLTDFDLIKLVRSDNDSAALIEITNRHTGIYMSIVNRYSQSGVNVNDLVEDRALNIYNMTRSYNPDKGMKFSTFVGEQTKYICLDEITKRQHSPSTIQLQDGGYIDDSENVSEQLTGRAIDMCYVAEAKMIKDRDVKDLAEVICEEVHDKRFEKLVELRHFNPSGKPATWRECGDILGLSYEGARWLYNKYKDKLAKELHEEIV